MDETVNAIFDFDKCAEVSQITHATGDARSDLVTLAQGLPRVRLHLLHAEADAARFRINAEHFASTVSPTLTSLLGCFMRFDQLISETWTRPFNPGSSSINAP
jgi:hypothetical protein